jgi:hypothetical protein
MLAHTYRPSNEHDQKYEVMIFVLRHARGDRDSPYVKNPNIESAIFQFGPGWKNLEITTSGKDGVFSVRVHAWGTFLVACRLLPKGERQKPITLYRFIDFSMDGIKRP